MKIFGLDFTDKAQELLRWILSARRWSTVEGVIANLLLILISIAVLFWVAEKVIGAFAKLVENWKKLGLHVRKSPESVAALRNKRQFYSVLKSDLAQISKAENWNDQWFTDLEAEVEFEGRYYARPIDKLLNRVTTGLRRLPSLTQAIEDSAEQFLLVVGVPGSGKSVALRHLATQMAEKGYKSKDLRALVPLYVNLKELPISPHGGPTADFIRDFVLENVRRGDSDTAEFVRSHWQDYRSHGTWFFLFDSFDEIPAILHSPTGAATIDSHASAIRHFLQGMSGCRGVIASREFKGPRNLTWHKLKLLPLSLKKQRELVSNSFVVPELQQTLDDYLVVSDSRWTANPLFLALLCRFVKEEKKLPRHNHDLIIRHLQRLATRDVEYISRHFGVSVPEMLSGAEQIAVLLAEDSEISLAPTRDQIFTALDRKNTRIPKLDEILSALIYVKIGRCDVPHAQEGDRRFTFGHRRFQETLYVGYLAKTLQGRDIEALISNFRWREYAVAFIQTQDPSMVSQLVNTATKTLDQWAPGEFSVPIEKEFGGHLRYFLWADDPLTHLISLLHEGLAQRRECVTPDLQRFVSRVLEVRWEDGDSYDRLQVLHLPALQVREKLLAHIQWAIEKGPDDMRDAAFVASQYLDTSNSDVTEWIRQQLADRILDATTEPQVRRLSALATKLPNEICGDFISEQCCELRRWLSKLGINQLREALGSAGVGLKFRAASLGIILFYMMLFVDSLSHALAKKPIFASFASMISLLVFDLSICTALVYLVMKFGVRAAGRPVDWAYLRSCATQTVKSFRIDALLIRALFIVASAIILPGLVIHVIKLYVFGTQLSVQGYLQSASISAMLFVTGTKFEEQRFRRTAKRRLVQLLKDRGRLYPVVLMANSVRELRVWLEDNSKRSLNRLSEIRSLMRLLEVGPPQSSDLRLTPLMQGRSSRTGLRAVLGMLLIRCRLRHQSVRRKALKG
jgi:hypothetical protein